MKANTNQKGEEIDEAGKAILLGRSNLRRTK